MGLSIRPAVAPALFALSILTALASPQIAAAPFTATYGFSATDWITVPPNPPVATLEGSVTVTFDTSDTSLTERTTGITLNSLNVSLGSAIGFLYDPTGFLSGTNLEGLFIGGIQSGVGSVAPGTDDFGILIINPRANNPTLEAVLLSTASPSAFWNAQTRSISSVPLPLPLALLGAGLVGLYVSRGIRKT